MKQKAAVYLNKVNPKRYLFVKENGWVHLIDSKDRSRTHQRNSFGNCMTTTYAPVPIYSFSEYYYRGKTHE